MKPKIWVGIVGTQREVFKHITVPTAVSTPQYLAVIGPFRTRRGANFMAQQGGSNPHCQTVADAERLAKS